MAQWKRAGPITQRSEDQNLALLNILIILLIFHCFLFVCFGNSSDAVDEILTCDHSNASY